MRRTKIEAEATKQKILKVAIRLFESKGFEKTSMEEISRRAGFTRGATYWHFKDKIEIMEHLIAKYENSIANLISSHIVSDVGSADQLKNMLYDILSLYYDDNDFQQFIRLTWFKIEYTSLKRLRQSKEVMYEYFVEEVSRLLRQGKSEGTVKRDVNVLLASKTLLLLILGMYRLSYTSPDLLSGKQEAMRVLQTQLDSILTKS